MRSMTVRTLATATFLLLVAVPVHAQVFRDWTDRGFVNVNGGAQLTSADLHASFSLSAYDEQGSADASQRFKGGGAFDIGGGVRVWRNLAVGLGVLRVVDNPNASIVARIPHPLIYDRPRTATGSAGVQHSETGVHLQATWMLPLNKWPMTSKTTDRFTAAAFIGPSLFKVKQGFVSGIGFSEVGAPFSSVTLSGVTTASDTRWATGVNLGVDLSYRVTETLGAGLLMRYAGTSVHIRTAPDRTESINVGGLQIGVGARLRIKPNWRIW